MTSNSRTSRTSRTKTSRIRHKTSRKSTHVDYCKQSAIVKHSAGMRNPNGAKLDVAPSRRIGRL